MTHRGRGGGCQRLSTTRKDSKTNSMVGPLSQVTTLQVKHLGLPVVSKNSRLQETQPSPVDLFLSTWINHDPDDRDSPQTHTLLHSQTAFSTVGVVANWICPNATFMQETRVGSHLRSVSHRLSRLKLCSQAVYLELVWCLQPRDLVHLLYFSLSTQTPTQTPQIPHAW